MWGVGGANKVKGEIGEGRTSSRNQHVNSSSQGRLDRVQTIKYIANTYALKAKGAGVGMREVARVSSPKQPGTTVKPCAMGLSPLRFDIFFTVCINIHSKATPPPPLTAATLEKQQ